MHYRPDMLVAEEMLLLPVEQEASKNADVSASFDQTADV